MDISTQRNRPYCVMDEFFQKDALDYARYRMGKSYCFRMKDDTQTIVACFSFSN